MTQPTNLFGENVPQKKKRPTRLEKVLLDFDKNSFEERLSRLQFVDKVFPKGHSFLGQMELIYTFEEAKNSFINGQFIATIILAQSFIEKVFHVHFAELGYEAVAKKGLNEMIKFGKKNNLINEFILEKVDNIRKIRNPFTHLKEFSYPHSLTNRIFQNRTQPYEQLEKDAKEAICFMFLVATYKF